MAKVKILGKIRSYKQSLKVYRKITKKDSDIYQIDRQIFWDIIKDYHKLIAESIINEGHDYKAPRCIGEIFIRKFKDSSLSPKLDYVEYNKTKKIEFVGAEFYEKYHAKWCWRKNAVKVKNVKRYSFKACFSNSRSSSKAVLHEGKDKVYSIAKKIMYK